MHQTYPIHMSNNTASSNNVTFPDAMDFDSIYLDPASASFSFPHFVAPTLDNVPQLPSSRSTPTRPVVKPNLVHTGGDSWLPLDALANMYWSALPYGSPPRNSLDINSLPPLEHNAPFDNDTPSLASSSPHSASSSPHSASSSAPDTSSTAFTLFSIVDDLDVKLGSSPYVGLLVDDIKPAEPAVWQGCIDPAELCAPLREPVDDDGDDDDMSEDDVPLALSLPPPPPPPTAPTRKRAHSPDTDDDGEDDAWAPAPKKTKKAQTQQKAAAQKATSPTKKATRRRGPARNIVAIARPAPLDAPAQPVAQTLLTRSARATTTSPAAGPSSTKKRPAPEAKESVAPSTSKRRKTAAPAYQSGDDEDSYVPSDNDNDKDGDFACSSQPRRRASSSSASTSSKPQAKSKSQPKNKTKPEGDAEPRESHRFFDPTAGPVQLGEEAWLCTALDDEHVCAGIFGRVPDVYRHIVSCHLGEERYLCASCGKRFNRGDARVRHWDSNKGCVEVTYVQQQQAIAAHWKHVKFVDGDLDKDTPLAAYNPNYE